MPSPKKPSRGKRGKLDQWISEHRPAVVGEAEWEELRVLLAPVSTGYLRRLLRESEAAMAPMVEGVRQENFDALERTLVVLAQDYESASATRRRDLRRLVMEARDHARFASKKPEKREEKKEMQLWMLTWLENPAVFAQWVNLRRKAGR